MIPKKLHFVWIGDEDKIPQYARFSMKKFQEINPDFQTAFHILTRDQIIRKIQSNDQKTIRIAKLALKTMKDKCQSVYDKLEDTAKSFSFWDMFTSIYCWMSNYLRFDILNDEGGIYCDLDCYPLRPFDDDLLRNASFQMKNGFSDWSDCFFIGCERGKLFSKDSKILENPMSLYAGNITRQQFNEIVTKFRKCNLDKCDVGRFSAGKDSYVAHMYSGDKFR